jgi:ABC-type transporter MlaC component
MANPKLKVSVNKNPTKEGVKVQFVFPQNVEGDEKAKLTQQLQKKLTDSLSQHSLTVSQDTDVPYSNVIGFLIPIADFKLMIKNAITGGSGITPEVPAPAPEETPQPPLQ